MANPAVLADAAQRYVLAGWPILPVTLPAPATTPDLSLRALATHRPPPDVDTARRWWSTSCLGLAAVVGTHFDVLAVPDRYGPAVAADLSACPPTAIAHPGGWWLFLTTAGATAPPAAPPRSDITLLRAGTYTLLPPTPTPAGTVEWACRTVALADVISSRTGWPHLPSAVAACRAAVRAATSGHGNAQPGAAEPS